MVCRWSANLLVRGAVLVVGSERCLAEVRIETCHAETRQRRLVPTFRTCVAEERIECPDRWIRLVQSTMRTNTVLDESVVLFYDLRNRVPSRAACTGPRSRRAASDVDSGAGDLLCRFKSGNYGVEPESARSLRCQIFLVVVVGRDGEYGHQ